jgi:hypothetical protein
MKRPREFGPFVSLLFLPLLLIAGAVTLLVAPFILLVQWRSEKSFASKMRAAGRAISWLELQTVIEREQGTMAAECLSEKGPSRLWWTPDDVRTECPHKCYPQRRSAELYYGPSIDPEYRSFFHWCYRHITSPQSGTGRLVNVPKTTGVRLKDMLHQLLERAPGAGFVATYSPQRLRERWDRPQVHPDVD